MSAASPLATTEVRLTYTGDADAVWLETFMPNFPGHLPFSRADDGSFVLDVDLPAAARIEYLIRVSTGGEERWINDPVNPITASNPFGRNSVLTGLGYRRPPWRPASATVAGRTSEIRVLTGAGRRRRHHVYSPPGTDPTIPLPLVVVHDGSEYVAHAELIKCVEWMVARREIRPVRLVLLDPRLRNDEFVADDSHADHIVTELLPHVRRRFTTVEPLGIMGASLGAVASWHAAWRHPGVFTRLLLQSGTFAFDRAEFLDEQMFSSINEFVEQAVVEPRLSDSLVAMSCGRYEGLIDWNRRVARDLLAHRVRLRFEEAWAGHDWGAWSDALGGGLRFLYGIEDDPVGPGSDWMLG